jgi:hypothetical protein
MDINKSSKKMMKHEQQTSRPEKNRIFFGGNNFSGLNLYKAGTDSEGMSEVALLAGTYYVKVAAATWVNDASYTLINQINYFSGDTYEKY